MPAPKKGSEAWLKRQKQREDAIIWAEHLYHYKLIGRAVGLTDETLKAWRDDDPEFSHQIEQARTRFLSKQMRKARPEFLLERLDPEIFKQRTESDLTSGGEKLTSALVQFVGDEASHDPDTK